MHSVTPRAARCVEKGGTLTETVSDTPHASGAGAIAILIFTARRKTNQAKGKQRLDTQLITPGNFFEHIFEFLTWRDELKKKNCFM